MSILILRQKSYFLGPTTFEIPQQSFIQHVQLVWLNLDQNGSNLIKLELLVTSKCVCIDRYLIGIVMSHTITKEKCGMDFTPLSGEAKSGDSNFPMSHELLDTSDK